MSVEGAFEKRCLTAGAPTELSFITTSISIVFTVTNIPGNILIILAVVFDPNKNLRTPFNWLIVNLATADLIVGTITDPISVYVHIKEGLGENITLEEIKTIHMTYFISCTASVLSLASLAIERYLAVRKPNTYRTSVTNKRIMFTVAGVWLIALSLPSIYFEVGYTTYAFIFANTSITVAIAITCLTYTLMLRKFKERSQNMTNNNDANVKAASFTTSSAGTSENEVSQDQSSSATTYPTNTNPSNSIIASARQMEAKVTKMFIIVLIAMLCCYGPSTIFIYIMNFCESCSCKTLHWFRDLQFIFVIMNSSVNFFCYALQSPRFRSAFTKILKMKKRQNQDDQYNSNVSNIQSISFSDISGQKERVQLEKIGIEIEMKNEGITNEGLENAS